VEIADVTKNTKILISGTPFVVEEVNFVKPGKGRGIYRLKLRSLSDGSTRDITYHSGDKVDEVSVTSHEMQYHFEESDHYVFMDTGTFEQHRLTKDLVGTKSQFLKEGTVVTISMMGGNPLDITLPKFVELKVVRGAISMKTDTITAQSKMVELETGASIGVPPFVKEGDVIKVDTRTNTYVERVSGKR
jgi:elongation factor P